MVRDLQAREYLLENMLPDIYDIDIENMHIDYEYLNNKYVINTDDDLKNLVDLLICAHRNISDKLKKFDAHEIVDDPKYIQINEEVRKYFRIDEYGMNVKIGDLKPEHLFHHDNGGIVICDYETTGYGLFFEDVLWLHVCCEDNADMDIFSAAMKYCVGRFGGLSTDVGDLIKLLYDSIVWLSSKDSVFEQYVPYWEHLKREGIPESCADHDN